VKPLVGVVPATQPRHFESVRAGGGFRVRIVARAEIGITGGGYLLLLGSLGQHCRLRELVSADGACSDMNVPLAAENVSTE